MSEVAAPPGGGSPSRSASFVRPELPSGWTALDTGLSLALAAAVLLTRLPLRTQMLFNWDSANFALALQHFDVTQHRPHPPGYPLFVASAGLAYRLGLDANTSLVLVAALLSASAVVALYWLGRAAYGRSAGLAASALLLTSVSFWSAGEVALAYPALALVSSLLALYVWRTQVDGQNRALAGTLAYALGAGFRPDLLMLLGPLWLFGLSRQARRTQAGCVALAILCISTWAVPTALLSNGFSAYAVTLTAYFGVDVMEKYSSTQSGAAGLLRNLRDTASYLFYALYATTPLLVAAAVWWAARWRQFLSRPGILVATWLAPILLFYAVVHIGDPGYVFSFLPALLLLTARPFAAWLERGLQWRRWAVAGLLVLAVAANASFFLARPGVLTLPGLRANDDSLRLRMGRVQADYPPQSTLLLSYATYKHLQFYLPQYDHNQWVDVFQPDEQGLPLAPELKAAVLVDPVLRLAPGTDGEPIELAPGVAMTVVRLQPGQTLVSRGGQLELR